MPRDDSRNRGRASGSDRPRRTNQTNSNGRPASGRSNAYERLRGTDGATVRTRQDDAPVTVRRSWADEPIGRRRLVLGLLALGMGAGVLRLADYQIIEGDRYRARADQRRLTAQTLYAKRGTIYDRNGNVLARTVDCKNVYVNPHAVKNPDKAVRALVSILGVDGKTCRKQIESDEAFVYIKRQVDADEAKALQKRNIAGIGFEPAVKRVYPYGNLASQVLGVVNTDHVGITGIEKQYEDVLAGTDGSIVRERAADGTFIAGGAYKKVAARDGSDLVLGIDVSIQQVAEEALKQGVEDTGAQYGSAVVIDPTTGEILAACSYPTYDQSDLAHASTADMNLRLVTDAYEPGSVFKTIVCAGGIDQGIITEDSTFQVPASIKVGDGTVTDDDKRDYGMTMTTREILRRSSNVGMVCVGRDIGADAFDKHVIGGFKIGKSSGIDFPGENLGIVKHPGEYDGSTLGSMSFGQGLSVSPIEIARAVGAIANGGVMTVPHFVTSAKGEQKNWDGKKRRAVSKYAAAQVASMMETVVEEGTGTAAQIAGYEVAGKTGTAEQASSSGGYKESSFMSSFIGFAPASAPQALCYITLDHTPQHGSSAAVPFRTIMAKTLDVLGVKPTT